MAKAKFKDIIGQDKAVLVDFSAEWCGPCKMMQPILQQVKKQMGDSVSVVKIDVDRNPAIAQRYNIRSVPTLMIFRKGDLKWKKMGVVQAAELSSELSKVAA